MELVVFACLLAEPRHCEEFHVPFVQPAVVECMSRPTTREVIRWAHEHPLWTIKSWTCGPPRA